MTGKKEKKIISYLVAWLKIVITVLDVFPGNQQRRKKRDAEKRPESENTGTLS
jgi:hypothetical protein